LILIKLNVEGLHEKYREETCEPKQLFLENGRKPRGTCSKMAGHRTSISDLQPEVQQLKVTEVP
jgi:hypothetical protein